MAQLVTRVDDSMVAAIDELVARGRFESRSDVVRAGVTVLLEQLRRERVGDLIVAGYDRVPETAEEMAVAFASARAMIAEEPW